MNYKNIIVGVLVWSFLLISSIFFMRHYNPDENNNQNSTKQVSHSYRVAWFVEINSPKKTKIFHWLKKQKYPVDLLYTYPKSKISTHLRIGPYAKKTEAEAQQKSIMRKFKIKTIIISEAKKWG